MWPRTAASSAQQSLFAVIVDDVVMAAAFKNTFYRGSPTQGEGEQVTSVQKVDGVVSFERIKVNRESHDFALLHDFATVGGER